MIDEISKKRFYKMQMNGGPAPDDPMNLSMEVDWKELRQQRKMKLKNLKDRQVDFKAIKPKMKKRATLVDKYKGAEGTKAAAPAEKGLVANLAGDETVDQFPDTRSEAA